MGIFVAANGKRGVKTGPPPKNLSHISYNDETWHCYTLPKEDLKIYKSRDTHLLIFFTGNQQLLSCRGRQIQSAF